jgi:hypothetical protein
MWAWAAVISWYLKNKASRLRPPMENNISSSLAEFVLKEFILDRINKIDLIVAFSVS